MRVAIIGAGAAGLASVRQVSSNGFDCKVFEMGPDLGGTWVYTDNVGKDRYGYPIYSTMYKGLRANLPKEVMGFPDFSIPEESKSYLTRAEILDFLKLYAQNFNLRPLIQFNSIVIDIRPLEDQCWKLTYVYKPTNEKIIEIYDAVMICNGHYNDPIIPNLSGQEKFKGKIEHSHVYRSPDPYKNQRVLVVGAGPTGLDLTLQLSKVAEHVVLSHHSPKANKIRYPDNVDKKPDIKCIRDFEMVEFVDGSCCCFDVILLCTGYKYSFPFLHESCRVTVDENYYTQPLYKHMIHIEKPTMCFIGIPFHICAFHMFDLQARYFCKSLNGSMPLPTMEDMRMHTEREMQDRWAKGYTKRQAHMLGPHQQSYYDDLAAEANTIPIAPVLAKLRDFSVKRLYDDLLNFREDRYKIVDKENYVKVQ